MPLFSTFRLVFIFALMSLAKSQMRSNRNEHYQAPSSSGVTQRYDYPQNRCYSCMSAMLETFYEKELKKYFYRPLNFTSACDGTPDPSKLQLVKCRTICLTITEEFLMLGRPTGDRLYMRGCALSLSKRGLNNRTLSMFDKADRCRNISAADLFYHGDVQSQPLRVCSCLGDRCNGAKSVTKNYPLLIIIIILAILWFGLV